MLTLVLGPVRSGKSVRAAQLATASRKQVIAALTLVNDPTDDEMRARIERHRLDRPASWTVVETGEHTPLERVLRDAPAGACVLVDALGTWLASLQLELGDLPAQRAIEALEARGDELLEALASTAADVVLVAEEAGWGVVPASTMGRVFRDALGRLSARIAARADRVELVVAGYAVDLRKLGTPIAP